jgi:hypothetical protein
VIGPVALSKSYKYYGEDGAVRKDINISQFYSEACRLAVQESVDWGDFDNDGDGVVDMVTVSPSETHRDINGFMPIWRSLPCMTLEIRLQRVLS